MAQHNLVFANERLFARKGEAVPAAGGTVSTLSHGCFSHVPHTGAKQQEPAKRKRGKREASPLASLITRGACRPAVAGDGSDALSAESSLFASWRQLRTRLETAHPSESDEPWKKLSFRLRSDQYARLKNLAGLWSTTYQSILEKAVSYYIDEATTSEDFKWKV